MNVNAFVMVISLLQHFLLKSLGLAYANLLLGILYQEDSALTKKCIVELRAITNPPKDNTCLRDWLRTQGSTFPAVGIETRGCAPVSNCSSTVVILCATFFIENM
jgi:hypothetical protein